MPPLSFIFAYIWFGKTPPQPSHSQAAYPNIFLSMRVRILAFVVWLASLATAVVLADSSMDGISLHPSNPRDSSFLEPGSGFGSELMAGPCAPDVIDPETAAKLRARREPCTKVGILDNDSGKGSGELPTPVDLELWRALQPIILPAGSDGDGCPADEKGNARKLICHEGPDKDIVFFGAIIENAIQCTFVPFCIFSVGESIERRYYISSWWEWKWTTGDEIFFCLGSRWCCKYFTMQVGWRRIDGDSVSFSSLSSSVFEKKNNWIELYWRQTVFAGGHRTLMPNGDIKYFQTLGLGFWIQSSLSKLGA